jgi:hypothetical protein
LDIQEKLIVIFPTSILYLKFKANSINKEAALAFLACFSSSQRSSENGPKNENAAVAIPPLHRF